MKIAIWHNTGAGGARRHLHDHIAGLLARGHTIRSWCLSSADQGYLPLGELVSERVLPVQVPDPGRGCLFQRARTRWREADAVFSAVDEACRRCAEEIRSGEFDVLLAAGCRLTIAPPLARHVNIPSVLYLQEPRRVLYEALPVLPWVGSSADSPGKRRGLRNAVRDYADLRNMRISARYERASAAAFDQLLVNSLFSRESVLRAYGLDSRMCYIGIDVKQFRSLGAAREMMVLGIGAYAYHKNIPFAIETIAAMPLPRPVLAWVGNGGSRALMNELKAYADSLSVPFEPRFGVSDEEMLDLYNRAKVLLCAPRLEPFGLVVLEAGACELPVVGVAEGGLRETIQDGVNGLLVEHDPNAAAEALSRLLEDATLAERLGKQGRAIVEQRWSLEDSVVRLESHLQSCASRPRRMAAV